MVPNSITNSRQGGDDLNRNEMEVLRVLFEEAPLRPSEIEERFGWEIENATLRSVLVGMVDRGLLKRRKVGKAYYYRPARTASKRREDCYRTLLRRAAVRLVRVTGRAASGAKATIFLR